MSCIVENIAETTNYGKNDRVAHFKFKPESTYLDVAEALDHTQENMGLAVQPDTPKLTEEDDQRRYTALANTGYFMGQRVTHVLQKKYHRDRTGAQVKNFRDVNNVRMEGGTFVHSVAEQIGKKYYADKIGVNSFLNPKDYATQGDGRFKLSTAQFNNIEKNIKAIVDEIFEKQNSINQRKGTSGFPEVRFEQILVDPLKDVAGTMDVVAIFNDRSAMIYDFKSMSVGSVYRSGKKIVREGFIYTSKKDGWKMQLSEYKKILMQRYGVKDVLGTRIVPIWVDYKYDTEKEIYTDEIRIVQTGEQSEFLKQVMATYERTGTREIDTFLKNRYERLEKLKEKATRDFTNREVYQTRIKRIEDSIFQFIVNEDIKDMIADTASVMNRVLGRLNIQQGEEGFVSLEELNDAVAEGRVFLEFLKDVGQTYDVGPNKEDTLYKQIHDTLREHGGTIDNLNKVYGHIVAAQTNRVVDSVEQNFGVIRDETGRIELREDTFATQVFGRLSQFDNPFFQEFNRLKDESLDSVRQNVERVTEDLAKSEAVVGNWLSSRGENHSDLVRYLVNRNTDNLFAQLGSKFFEDQGKAREDENLNFFTENYEVREGWADWFTRKVAEIREEGTEIYKGRDNAQQLIDDYVNRFAEKNNLSVKDGKPLFPQAWLKGSKFFWLKVKDSSLEKYASEEYKFISAHEPLKQFYHTLVDLNEEFRNILNVDYGTVPNNFLPNIRADFVERFARGEFKGAGSNVLEMFGAIQQDETIFGQHADLEKGLEREKKIPIFFTNPFRDGEGRINTGEKSYDFARSMQLFAKMAYTHKYMNEIEAQTLAIKDVMASRVEYFKEDARGQKVYDFMGNLATKKHAGGSQQEKILNAFIDYYLYGVRIDREGINKRIFGIEFNSTKALLGMKNYMSLKALGLGFIPAASSYLAARTNAWTEGKKGVIYNSGHWHNATKMMISSNTNKKYHAMGHFFGVFSGDITEYTHLQEDAFDITKRLSTGYKTPIQRYVNARMLMRPYSYGDERLDKHITVAMAQNYGIDENGNVRRLQNLPEGTESLWDKFTYNHETGKAELKDVSPEGLKKIRIAFRNAVRAGQQSIKGTMTEEDISMSQINLITNLMMHFKTWMPGIVKERFGKLNYNRFLDAPEWGRYSALGNEIADIQDATGIAYLLSMLGRSLKITARELTRLGGGKGYTINRKKAKIAFELMKEKNPERLKDMSLDDFIEIKQKQLRAALIEIGVMSLFALGLIGLAMDWDDDGTPLYREMWVLHKTYQILNRTYTEIASFVPVNAQAANEMKKLVRTPFPISGLLMDAGNIVGNTWDETLDLLTGRKDTRDRTGKLYHTFGLIPGGLQLRRLMDLYEQDARAQR